LGAAKVAAGQKPTTKHAAQARAETNWLAKKHEKKQQLIAPYKRIKKIFVLV